MMTDEELNFCFLECFAIKIYLFSHNEYSFC